MPRKQLCRRICGYPDNWSFSPDEAEGADEVKLTLDEYEAIRFIDLEGLTQDGCAKQMEVSRTTITAIYASARRKLAEALINGKRLIISGGSYRLDMGETVNIEKKGERTMRIAVPYENGNVFGHFGHTTEFKIYELEDGKITSSRTVPTNGQGHGALAGFLKTAEVDALICGGIGGGARSALAEAGITLYPGVSGSADEAAQALAEGRLDYKPDAVCNHHHEHHEHDEHHDCGNHHGCGGHDCGKQLL